MLSEKRKENGRGRAWAGRQLGRAGGQRAEESFCPERVKAVSCGDGVGGK